MPLASPADYPKYKLYAYSEGAETASAAAIHSRRRRFSGTPVLFVHGNAGTYKQMRSLASVSLRKAIDLARNGGGGGGAHRHLDYFAVDFDGEFSALFGGYLQPQADYLMHCVHAIRALYDDDAEPKAPGLIVIAHSMGGKVAQAAMQHANVSSAVHTLLMIAAPVDRPVLNADFYTAAFYGRVDAFWQQHRSDRWVATNRTQTCCGGVGDSEGDEDRMAIGDGVASAMLDHVLLVTIGGGVRDRLVHAGLTSSRFSDVHVMVSVHVILWVEPLIIFYNVFWLTF